MNPQNKKDKKSRQYNSSDTILMVRPANFGSNPQTLADNAFQQKVQSKQKIQSIKQEGIKQFDNYVKVLQQNGVNVIVAEDLKEVVKPDAVFPNNWFTTHHDSSVIIYPMKPENRRLQIYNPTLYKLNTQNYLIQTSQDLSNYVKQQKFLQGTGSMVFDHQKRIAYACKSQRTNHELFLKVCNDIIHYKPIFFQATDQFGKHYYHTNVIMSVCSDFVIICLQAIKSDFQRQDIINSIKNTGIYQQNEGRPKQIIEITKKQVNSFCGNVLQVRNKKGQKLLTMSTTAYKAFTQGQKQLIKKHCNIVHTEIQCIQKYGGGGTRCMMAQIFLSKK